MDKRDMANLDKKIFGVLNDKKCPKCSEKMLWDNTNKIWYCPDCYFEMKIK